MYLLVAFLFALNGSFSKAILEAGISPVRLTEIRNAGAVILLLAVVLATRPAGLRVQRSEIPFLVAYGLIAFGMTQMLYFLTISRLPVGIGTLLIFLAPVIVALWLRFGRRTTSGSGIWWALALVVAGLGLVSQVWSGAKLDTLGIIAGLATAVSLSIYLLLGEVGVRRRDVVSLTFWGFAIATVMWSVVAPWWSYPWEVLGSSADFLDGRVTGVPVWSLVVWMITLGTVVPFLLVVGSLQRIGAQRAGILGTTEPVWAALLAFIILGETITGIQAVGGLIVLAGIVVAEVSVRRTSARV